MTDVETHCACWYCGHQLVWLGDFGADEYYGEGVEGIVTELYCSNPDCGARWQGSIVDNDEVFA